MVGRGDEKHVVGTVLHILCGCRARVTRSAQPWNGMGAGERGVDGMESDVMQCAGCEGAKRMSHREAHAGYAEGRRDVVSTMIDGREGKIVQRADGW
jgi:hypothetical protein